MHRRALLLALVAAACSALPSDPASRDRVEAAAAANPTPLPDDPAARGFAAARQDIASGSAHLWTLGFPCDSNSGIDPETGLLRVSDGCVGSPDEPELAAYNTEVRRAAAAGEIDRDVFLDRIRTAEQVAARLAAAPAVVEGSPVSLLDGRFRAELSAYFPPASKNAVGGRWLRLFDSGGSKPRIQMLTSDAVAVAVDPDGRTLLVRDGYRMCTFDLATGGGCLQFFPAPLQSHPSR